MKKKKHDINIIIMDLSIGTIIFSLLGIIVLSAAIDFADDMNYYQELCLTAGWEGTEYGSGMWVSKGYYCYDVTIIKDPSCNKPYCRELEIKTYSKKLGD